MPMHRHPDFLAALRMNEQPVTALAGALLDEAAFNLRMTSLHVTRQINLSLGLHQVHRGPVPTEKSILVGALTVAAADGNASGR